MAIERLRALILAKKDPPTLTHAARTAVAAVVLWFVAHGSGLPEAYWAAISTMIVMQSTLGSSLGISAQRFAGTVVGAALGGLLGTYFPGNVLVFGAAVFGIGAVCAAVRVERSAYRYAGITLAIVMLISRPRSPWVIALHRFLEVSIGIVVGLAISAVWPERRRHERQQGFISQHSERS